MQNEQRKNWLTYPTLFGLQARLPTPRLNLGSFCIVTQHTNTYIPLLSFLISTPLQSISSKASAPSSSASSSSGVASLLGKTIFRGNLTYVTYILGGCIILEGIYGTVLDGFWNSVNHGRTYKSVDWSKFKTEDDEE